MPETKIYVIGDSHARMMQKASRRIDPTALEFRPFGAVKQSLNPHHRLSRDMTSIELLEEHWRERSLPFSPDDLGNPSVRYYISLPFNVYPMLRRIDVGAYTLSVSDSRRAFLSRAAREALFVRRNRMAISLVTDMMKIGLSVGAIESPRPFADAPLSEIDNDMIVELSNQYYEYTQKQLLKAGATVIGQPTSTIDGSGQTKAEFRSSEDNQHGNMQYYSMVVSTIGYSD
jgi:hypothetical protein